MGTASSGKLLKCAQCGKFYYCSRDCQKKHWKNTHKHECLEAANRPSYSNVGTSTSTLGEHECPPEVSAATRLALSEAFSAASAESLHAVLSRFARHASAIARTCRPLKHPDWLPENFRLAADAVSEPLPHGSLNGYQLVTQILNQLDPIRDLFYAYSEAKAHRAFEMAGKKHTTEATC